MWQAIKKFRQAYLDAKGDRLHAEAEASRNALCSNRVMSVEEAQNGFGSQGSFFQNLGDTFDELYEENCQRGDYS